MKGTAEPPARFAPTLWTDVLPRERGPSLMEAISKRGTGMVVVAIAAVATICALLVAESAGAQVIRACVAKKTHGSRLKGSFRRIGPNGHCRGYERLFTWNSAGPAGSKGPMGAKGAAGAKGAD